MTYLDAQRAGDADEGMRRPDRLAWLGETRGERIVRRLRGSATTRMTTDEILALTRGED